MAGYSGAPNDGPTILFVCKVDADGLDFFNYCHDWAWRLNEFLEGGVSIKIKSIASYLCEFRWRGKFLAKIFDDRSGYPAEPGFYCAESYTMPVAFRFKPDELWERVFRPAIHSHVDSEIKKIKIFIKKVLTEKP